MLFMGLFLIELRSLQGYKKLGIPVVSIVNYGLHQNDLLQIEGEKEPMAKFVKKIDEEDIEVEFNDKSRASINKNKIISVVQVEKNGRLTYIKYRD